MRRLYNSIGGFNMGISFGLVASPQPAQLQQESFNEILLKKFVLLLQQFVGVAEKGLPIDKALFRETCSQATALLLSQMVYIFLELLYMYAFV
jgi:phosphatidylinositol 4-kinase